MQQAQESTAEAETECGRGFRLEGQGSIIELEPLQRVAQVRKVRTINRVNTGEHHRIRITVARERIGCPTHLTGDGVTDAGLTHVLDARDEVADLAGTDPLFGLRLG